MQNKFSKIYDAVEESIQIIPGIAGFESINKENNINDYLIIDDYDENAIVDIKLGIVVDRNVSIDNVSKQINESLKYNLKKHNIKQIKLSIYVKGVK